MTAGPLPQPVPDLAGDRVVLTRWRDEDAAAVVELADDPASRAWSPSMRDLRDLDDARRWMERRATDPDRVDWAVRDPATGRLVGRVNLHRFGDGPASAEIGYGVHPAHRRRGVAREAAEVATRFGYDVLGLHRIALIHAVGNLASCAVATRSGFAFEGIERAALDHGDGVLHDVHRHARLATDPTPET